MTFDFYAALIVGLLGGGHCIAMCGGVVGAFSVGLPAHARLSLMGKLPYLASYNLGRIASYSLAGALIGGSASFFVNQLGANQWLVWLRLMAATLVILLGLYIGRWWSLITRLESLGRGPWRLIQPLASRWLPFKHPAAALPFGMVWGWLPCGLVYSTLSWAAAAGSADQGAWIMLGFGLGTLPAMLSAGLVAQRLASIMENKGLRWVSAAIIVGYGVQMAYVAINQLI